MASLFITIFKSVSQTALGTPIQDMTPVTVGAGSLQSEVVTGSTEYPAGKRRRYARLFSDTDCHVAWGSNPTAGTSNFPVGAENPEYVEIGAGEKFAVIQRV